MPKIQRISPCLWFDSQAEQAAKLYVKVFPRSRILRVNRYSKAGVDIHGRKPGSVMTVDFILDGQAFTALNGGPIFTFSEAISFQVMCSTQKEIDHYWKKLSAGGDPKAQQCGWLKDRFGLSWQIAPKIMADLIKDHRSPKTERAMAAMMGMKKLDIAALKRAHAGR